MYMNAALACGKMYIFNISYLCAHAYRGILNKLPPGRGRGRGREERLR
jgi:hypothetical protein